LALETAELESLRDTPAHAVAMRTALDQLERGTGQRANRSGTVADHRQTATLLRPTRLMIFI
jgi:hypothetical protein